MSPSTTLYYPYIHPRRMGDLKAALLFWDRVRRIVPASVTHGERVMDDDAECVALTESELLVSTRPEPYEAAAAATFFRCIEPHRGHLTIDLATASDMAATSRGIHIEKIGGPVLHEMQEQGIAHRLGDWVHMHDQVGALYMFCLASEMGKRMSVPLLSDASEEAALGEALLFEPEGDEAVTETLLQMGIDFPSGAQLENVSAQDIIKFCQRRAPEKLAFREQIERLNAVARTSADPNAVADHLATQKTHIHAAVKDIRRCFDEIKVGAAVGALTKITVPAGIGAAIGSLALPASAVASLATMGIVVSAIACYAETRGKLRQARAASPYHYLLTLKERFGIEPVREARAPAGEAG